MAACTRMYFSALSRRVCLAALLLCAVPYGAAESYSGQQYQRAQRMHASLDGKLTTARTQQDYRRVMDAYRSVYGIDPNSPYAIAAMAATADLYAEEGRVFHSPELLRKAIGQYEVLRRQYPGSEYAYSALLNEGDIYELDLGDLSRAKRTFELFLRLYPHSSMGVEARYELAAIRRKEHPAEARRETAAVSKKEIRAVPPKRFVPKPVTTAATVEPVPAPAMTRTVTVRRAQESERRVPQRREPQTMQRNASPVLASAGLPLVMGVQHWSTADSTRVVIRLQKEVQYEAARTTDPDRIFFDLYGARLSPELMARSTEAVHDGFLRGIRATQLTQDVTRVVLDVSPVSDYSAFYLPTPPRLIVDVRGRAREVAKKETHTVTNHSRGSELAAARETSREVKATPAPTMGPVEARVPGTRPAMRAVTRRQALPAPLKSMTPAVVGHPAAVPTLEPNAPTMVRALGLKIHRIVIDAGHGGHDSGTIGANGLEEKTVTLDVALRLGRLLQQKLGAEVFYTRDTDTFVPLETRTAIANKDRADLFISIHVNSNPDTAIRGVATYYLSFTNSADALELAARENAVSKQSIHQLSDLVKKIALNDKLNESRIFAQDVEQSLYSGMERGNPGFEDLGVKKAPFVVLIGANMPSILAEISFLSNPQSAHDLTEPAYRERIAESLYRGVANYVDSVNGMSLAQAGGVGR
ncbi:MAG: N-acetylmuramoyl-L-alanine amidase [Acidobacteriaceae bacterium]